MGKFDGVLMASDFDNTMAYTEGALRAGTPIPPLSAENRGAILYFMEEGGTFSVVTGRSLPSFDQVRSDIPMNGPTVLFNGAAIYDFAQSKYLYTAFLPETIRSHVTEILEALGRYPVRACYYGHLHGDSLKGAFGGERDGIIYRNISADNTGFEPVIIKK